MLLRLAFLGSAFLTQISFGLLHTSWRNGQVSHEVLREEGVALTGQLCQGDPGISEVGNVTDKPLPTLEASV